MIRILYDVLVLSAVGVVLYVLLLRFSRNDAARESRRTGVGKLFFEILDHSAILFFWLLFSSFFTFSALWHEAVTATSLFNGSTIWDMCQIPLLFSTVFTAVCWKLGKSDKGSD